MKKLTRLGVLILLVGISLLTVTYLRNSPESLGMHYGGGLSTYSEYISSARLPSIWAPRELTIMVELNVPVDLYILDEEGINLWLKDKTIKPLLSYKNVEHDIFYSRIEQRGKYAYLIYNPSNSTLEGKLTIRFDGPEKDLLQSSTTVTGLGLIVIVVSLSLQRRQSKQNTKKVDSKTDDTHFE